MSKSESQRVEFSLDLRGMLEIAEVGVRRASAFLKLGSMLLEHEIPDDLSLSGGVAYGFWPSPISNEIRATLHSEFEAWIIGSCLKEIDQYFSLFLDQAWRIVEMSDLHGRVMHSSAVPDFNWKFGNDTNSASKAKKFSQQTNIFLDTECLDSLSRARNSLTHGIGQVRDRDVDHGSKKLAVRWTAMDLVVIDGSREVVYREKPVDTHQHRKEDGIVNMELRPAARRVEFDIGQRIRFSQYDLAEICMFYRQQANNVHNELIKYLKAKGIRESRK